MAVSHTDNACSHHYHTAAAVYLEVLPRMSTEDPACVVCSKQIIFYELAVFFYGKVYDIAGE